MYMYVYMYQGEILKRQVDELKGMLSEVKGYFTKFPMPPREPERMLVMNNGGFMNMSLFEKFSSSCEDRGRHYLDTDALDRYLLPMWMLVMNCGGFMNMSLFQKFSTVRRRGACARTC